MNLEKRFFLPKGFGHFGLHCQILIWFYWLKITGYFWKFSGLFEECIFDKTLFEIVVIFIFVFAITQFCILCYI